MAVLVIAEMPGGSAALDEVLTEFWRLAENPPAGNRFRLAGPMDGGWRIVSLWDSREQFVQFMERRLHVVRETLDGDGPSVTIWEIEHVERFD